MIPGGSNKRLANVGKDGVPLLPMDLPFNDCSDKGYQTDDSKPQVLLDSGNNGLSLQNFTRGKEMVAGTCSDLPTFQPCMVTDQVSSRTYAT